MVLSKLAECSTSDELLDVGISLTRPATITDLQKDLISEQMVFSQEEYWQEDCLSTHTVDELLALAGEEQGSTRVLHMLQALQKCCPVLSSTVERLLQRTTR